MFQVQQKNCDATKQAKFLSSSPLAGADVGGGATPEGCRALGAFGMGLGGFGPADGTSGAWAALPSLLSLAAGLPEQLQRV